MKTHLQELTEILQNNIKTRDNLDYFRVHIKIFLNYLDEIKEKKITINDLHKDFSDKVNDIERRLKLFNQENKNLKELIKDEIRHERKKKKSEQNEL